MGEPDDLEGMIWRAKWVIGHSFEHGKDAKKHKRKRGYPNCCDYIVTWNGKQHENWSYLTADEVTALPVHVEPATDAESPQATE